MAQTSQKIPERELRLEPGRITQYAEACRALPPGPLDRETIARLVRLERAAKLAWGQPLRRPKRTW